MVADRPAQGFPAARERIGLDTNVFIYFFEDHPRYGAWCASLFDLIERGYNPAVTSTVTLLELLVQPYREHKEELAQIKNGNWSTVELAHKFSHSIQRPPIGPSFDDPSENFILLFRFCVHRPLAEP